MISIPYSSSPEKKRGEEGGGEGGRETREVHLTGHKKESCLASTLEPVRQA
jgi:hypothetical protein